MICPVCHKPVRDTANFCEHCGSKLSSFRMCPNPKCRQHVSSTAKFCPHCGTNINTGELSPALKELFRFAIGGYYGYKSRFDGNVYIKPQFDYAEEFEGDYAIVRHRDLYGVINRMGKFVLEIRYSKIMKPMPNSVWNYWICESGEGTVLLSPDSFKPSSELFSHIQIQGTLAIVTSTIGKQGLISHSLNKILECEYDSISFLCRDYYAVTKDRLTGIYDKSRHHFTIPCKYRTIFSHNLGFKVWDTSGKVGILSFSGEVIVDCIMDRIERVKDFDLYSCLHVFDNQVQYVSIIDEHGKAVIPDKHYHSVSIILSQYFLVQDSSGKYGFLSLSGEVLTKCMYDQIGEYRVTKIKSLISNKKDNYFHLIQVNICQLWGVLCLGASMSNYRNIELVPCISHKRLSFNKEYYYG